MTAKEFAHLIELPESETLDFKRSQYRLINGNEKDLSGFIKDVIALVNTPRSQTSYIILGIEDGNGEKVLHGINQHYDDSLFQDKIKDKVYPRPIFNYFSIDYQGKRCGIIKVPVRRYEKPVTSKVKLRGLEPGQIYFRRGSTNSEANHSEVVEIYQWISSVAVEQPAPDPNDSIRRLIEGINRDDYYAPFLPEALKIAQDIGNNELMEFVELELSGWSEDAKFISGEHRSLTMFTSFAKIIGTTYPKGTPASVMWNQLEADEDFWKGYFLYPDPIVQIEAQVKRARAATEAQFISRPVKASELFPNNKKYQKKDHQLFMYWSENDLEALYIRSKQKFITLLTNSLT